MPADSEHSIKGTVEIPNLSEENDVMSEVDVSHTLAYTSSILYTTSAGLCCGT